VFTAVICGQGNSRTIDESVIYVCLSINACTGIVGAIVVGPYLLRDRLTAVRYRSFLETVLLGLPEDALLVVRQKWLRHDIAPAHYGQAVRQWLSASYPVATTERPWTDHLTHAV
jgi:hypothetical protein